MIDQMDAEHEVMAERLTAARNAMAALRSAPTAANAQTARTAMDELKTVTTEHLEHEERELEPVYQAKKDDPGDQGDGAQVLQGPSQGGRGLLRLVDRRDQPGGDGEHQRHHPQTGTRRRQRPARSVVHQADRPRLADLTVSYKAPSAA